MNSLAEFIATGFYAGRAPKMPGTIGTLLALVIYLFLPVGPQFVVFYWVWLIIWIIIGTWAAHQVQSTTELRDPPYVVIDEMCGFFVTMAFLPKSFGLIVLGFAIFRLLDIYKPFGIRTVGIPKGGVGIMADDIYAGMVANLILQLIHAL